MDQTARSITIRIRVFKGAFPKRDTIPLPEDAKVRDLVASIEARYFADEEGEPPSLLRKGMAREDLLLILNGHLINNPNGLDTVLKDGDELVVFPVMAGG